MARYPKVRSVAIRGDRRLLVTFDNGVRKLYDCAPLLETEPFGPLREEWLFRSVRADPGGYGISWSDELDLSESELWENGCAVEGDLVALS